MEFRKSFDLEIVHLKTVYSEALEQLALLALKENEELVSSFDFSEIDKLYHPLVFDYFCGNSDRYALEQVLFTLIPGDCKVSVKATPENVVYVPYLGYFLLEKESSEEMFLVREGSIHRIEDANSNVIPSRFIEVCEFDGIEIVQYNLLPYLQKFRVYNPDISIYRELTEVEVSNTFIELHTEIIRALTYLRDYYPDLFEAIKLTNKQIIFFRNKDVISFVDGALQGAVFITHKERDGFVMILEELIHQCSHNILNAYLFNYHDYFLITKDVQLQNYTQTQNDYRTIFSAFHGLYTVMQRVVVFYDIVFSGRYLKLSEREKMEFIGRYCDQYPRFRTGLQKLNLQEIYTEKGIALYTLLDGVCEKYLFPIEPVLKFVDVVDQPQEFDFTMFLESNTTAIIKKFEDAIKIHQPVH